MSNLYDDNLPPTIAPPVLDPVTATTASDINAPLLNYPAAAALPVAQNAFTSSDYIVSPTGEPYHPDNPPWGLLTGFGVWLASVLALAFVPLVLVVPNVIWRFKHGGVDLMQLGDDKMVILLSLIGTFPAHFLTLALVWAVATKFGKLSLREMLGLSWSENFKPWQAIVAAVGLLIVGSAAANLLGNQQKTSLDLLIASSAGARYTAALLAGITAPVVEEFVYRGILYSAAQRTFSQVETLGQKYGTWLAVALVTLLFAGVHVAQYIQNFAVIAVILVLSFVLTMVRAKTGRLLPSIVIHAVFNGIQALVLIFAPHLAT